MGFCRLCGSIVKAERCTCGGRPVEASYSWNASKSKTESPDRWSQTYTNSITPTKDQVPTAVATRRAAFEPTKPITPIRFPRPQSTQAPLNSGISAHIQATTSTLPASPLKQSSVSLADTLNSSPSGNPVLDDGMTLSKVYGSVLQNPENLKTYACANCNAVFSRDTTLYPDPESPVRLLCRNCFISTGGTKGMCEACEKPVLKLKAEGQYVENSGKLWHKKCFVCNGCEKNIAANASVDLFGRPCCAECFDTSLHQPTRTPNGSPGKMTPKNNLGGMKGSTKESSPALEELSRRLGIANRDDSSTEVSSPSQRLVKTVHDSPHTTPTSKLSHRVSQSEQLPLQTSTTRRPLAREGLSGIPRPKSDKKKSSTPRSSLLSTPSTPDLMSDSDTAGASTCPPTPKEPDVEEGHTTSNFLGDNNINNSSLCGKCQKPLFSINGGGRIVTVPQEDGKAGKFHSSCFVCAVCLMPFIEQDGTAGFVHSEQGITHLKCAPPLKVKIVTRPRPVSTIGLPPREPPPVTKEPIRPSSVADSAVSPTAPFIFPNRLQCAGCQGKVAVFEPGVIHGPSGSRWHSRCLICGGKGAKRRIGEPGCGKQLDRDAKVDSEGHVWCSSCMRTLQAKNPKSPLSPNLTGNSWQFPQPLSGSVSVHSTGGSASTIQTQYTGGLIQQLTGTLRASSPTRIRNRSGSVSPTKRTFGGAVPLNRTDSAKTVRVRPRPKSVSIIRSPTGLGRGMQLVRQMTGNSNQDL